MSNYLEEFKEYINFIKKKSLRNILNQLHFPNLIKLGILLNATEYCNPKIKKSLLVFHKSCRDAKFNRKSDNHLISFKLKLAKISKRIINDIANRDCGRNERDIFSKKDKPVNIWRLKKLIFIKKHSRIIPSEIHRLIAEICFDIGESITDDELNSISPDLSNENIFLRRKRFSRQLKESLVKYCNDFNNFREIKLERSQLGIAEDDFLELKEYLANFDASISSSALKTFSDIDNFVNCEINLNHSPSYHLEQNINELDKPSSVTEDMDFQDFNVIEEWNEGIENTSLNLCSDFNLKNNTINDLISNMEEISNNLLNSLCCDKSEMEQNKCWWDLFSCVTPVDLSRLFNNQNENKAIYNLQQSFHFDFCEKINKISEKMKTIENQAESKTDGEEELFCNRNFYSRPKTSIKIMNLKKPHAYSSMENVKEQHMEEILLHNIPLPNRAQRKTNVSNCHPPQQTSPIINIIKEIKVDEESDTAEEELIPQSILDFSEVRPDEFERKENLNPSSNDLSITNTDVNDYQINETTEERSIVLKPECQEEEGNLKIQSNSSGECYEDNTYLDQSDDRMRNQMNVHYRKPTNTFCKSNYSIFSLDEANSNMESQSYYEDRDQEEYMFNEYSNEFMPYNRSYNQHCSYYYDNSNIYNNTTHNTISNNCNINSYRYFDRGNRRLFRNFLRYTCQSNHSDRRYFNEPNRFNNGFT